MNPYSNRIHSITLAAGLLGFNETAKYLYAAHEVTHPENIKFYLLEAQERLEGEIFATHLLAEIRDILREVNFEARKYWLTACSAKVVA
jgi:hypothetical protein